MQVRTIRVILLGAIFVNSVIPVVQQVRSQQPAGRGHSPRTENGVNTTMTARQARKVLMVALKNVTARVVHNDELWNRSQEEPIQDIQVGADGFQFLDKGVRGALLGRGPAFADTLIYKFAGLQYKVSDKGRNVDLRPKAGSSSRIEFWWKHLEDAQQFVDALSVLTKESENPSHDAAILEDFKQKATAWRAAGSVTVLAEESRRHKVLAENAIREKNLDEALDEYEAALTTAPLWPEGQFNAALLCGELEDYKPAIRHMKYYLELLPDAPDSQAARDKILIWEHKIGVLI